MLSRQQLKGQGLRFARAMQVLFKTVVMFSPDHTAAASPMQNTFDILNALLKETHQFTIGFIEQRLMLNQILTTEKSISHLENEFLKRGIGAVTFEIGITMAAFRRVIGVITRQQKEIEEEGGLAKFLDKNPVEFVRIFPASKQQARDDAGDTILDVDSESFLMAKAFNEMRTQNVGFQGIDSFLQSGPGGPGGGGGGMGGGGTGSGTGSDSGEGGSGPEAFFDPTASGKFGTGWGSGFVGGYGGGGGAGGGGEPGAGPGGGGSGAGPGGGGPGGGGGYGPGGGGGYGPGGGGYGGGGYGQPPAPGGPADIQKMVEGFFNNSLLDSADAPQKSYTDLARLIRDMRPEMVLQSFPPARRDELRKLPSDQMAAEVIEDTAVKWACDRLATAPIGAEAFIVEEEVVRVLLRSLQSTALADRLSKKLAELIKQFSIPPSTHERIQDELSWVMLTSKEKTERLLKIEHYSAIEFRRLIETIKELKQPDVDAATSLGKHYFAMLESEVDPKPEEMSRVPELLRALAGVHNDFWQTTADKLCAALGRQASNPFFHRQVINGLLVLSKTVALYEDFPLIQNIGSALEKSGMEHPQAHIECCQKALTEMLTLHTIDRLIEIFIAKKDDGATSRTVATLLRWSGQPGVGKLFQTLEDEQVAANRLALLRLIGRIGPAALEHARKQLNSDRWYVVRNACKLLGELKDPEVLELMARPLRHEDPRVQKAAMAALMDSRDPKRAMVFADALGNLHAELLEDALGELLFLKDPQTLPLIEHYIFEVEHERDRLMVQAVQAAAAIPSPGTAQLLLRVVTDSKMDLAARRFALTALTRQPGGAPKKDLEEFATKTPKDSLAGECLKIAQAS